MDTVITKKGDKYYFTSEDNVYELNENTMPRLKVVVTLPAKVIFRDCPFSFIGSLISELYDMSVNMKVTRIGETSNYEAVFTQVKENAKGH